MTHQTATINDSVYFWFAANDTSGSGGDGATPLYDVREAGATASAIPLLSGTPTLLTHANYPAGCHEIAVAATTGNGFAADDTFAVFCTLAIDTQNPSGFVGSCTLTPLAKEAKQDIIDTNIDTLLTRIVGTLATGTHNPATAAQIAVLSDWINGGRLDLILDIIAADTTTDIPALIATVQADLDILTGTDGVTLATAQALYAPNVVVPDAAGVAPTAVEIRQEMDTNSADLNQIQADIAALNDIAASDVLTQVNAALDTAISELGVAAPTATPTLRTGLMLMYMALRNKTVVQTSGTDALEIYNDAGTKIAAKLLSDDGSDYTEAEMA